MGNDHSAFAGRVRSRRTELGLSQQELAAACGMSVRALRDIENGRVPHPRSATRGRLSHALQFPHEACDGLPPGARDGLAPAPAVRIEALGPLSVRVSDRPVPIESAMQRIVLGVLAVRPGQSVTGRALIDLLWGSTPPQTAAKLLHTYVARLRRRVRGLVIVGGAGGYRLDPTCADVDVVRFAVLAADARQAEAGGAPARAASCYRDALALWRDDLLADLEERVHAYPAVAALRRNRVDTALRYAAVAGAAGDQTAAAAELQQLVYLEPYHESLHAALMTLLAASGQQAEALAVFDAVRGRLRGELGLDPGPELRAAHGAVLRESSSSEASPADPPKPPRQLPARPTHFVGRDRELAELRRASETDNADRARVIAVCGVAGIGKTALVLRWAHESVERFPDGQLWMDLRGYGPGQQLNPGEVIEHLLRAVGVGTAQLPADLNARAAMLRSAVAGRRMLLVLDNARDSAQVRPLLPGDPALTTVVTSRDALRSMAAADGATRLHLSRLDAGASRELLSVSAPAAVVRAVAATRIVEHCDGLPLALRIVRERLATATDAEVRRFAAELGGDARLSALDLNEASSDFSVRGALNWSYRTLATPAATLLRRLPLCRVSIVDTATAAALADLPVRDTSRLLDTLVAAHLIEPTGLDRYRIHDLVTTFALERLHEEEAAADTTASRQRLVQRLARTAEATLALMQRTIPFHCPLTTDRRPHDPPSATEIGEHADMVAALAQDLLDDGQEELCWALLERGWHVTYTNADTTRFEPALMAAFDAADRMGRVDVAVRMNRLLAITYATHSSLRRAEQALQRGIGLATEAGLVDIAVSDTGNLARVWLLRGKLADARSAMRWVASKSATPNAVGRQPHLSNLLELEIQHGDLAAAEDLARTAHRYAADAADPDEVRELTVAIAQVHLLGTRWRAAEALLARVRDEDSAISNGELRARLLVLLVKVCRHTGELSRGEALARDALAITRRLGWPSHETEALGALADVRIAQGRADSALPILAKALARSRECALPYLECSTLLLLATAHHALGDTGQASEMARAAVEIADRCDYTLLTAQAARMIESSLCNGPPPMVPRPPGDRSV